MQPKCRDPFQFELCVVFIVPLRNILCFGGSVQASVFGLKNKFQFPFIDFFLSYFVVFFSSLKSNSNEMCFGRPPNRSWSHSINNASDLKS